MYDYSDQRLLSHSYYDTANDPYESERAALSVNALDKGLGILVVGRNLHGNMKAGLINALIKCGASTDLFMMLYHPEWINAGDYSGYLFAGVCGEWTLGESKRRGLETGGRGASLEDIAELSLEGDPQKIKDDFQ